MMAKSWGLLGIQRLEEPEFDEAKYRGVTLHCTKGTGNSDVNAINETHALDPVNLEVVRKIARRAAAGMATYGVGMDRTDKDTLFWLNNLLEELLDGAVYVQRVIHDLEKK